MPRQTKATIAAEPRETEVGMMGLSSNAGKTLWFIVRQVVGASTGRVYDYQHLDEDVKDDNGNVIGTEQVSFTSKAVAKGFLAGYEYARSELEENLKASNE
jgi:hypothetical protein